MHTTLRITCVVIVLFTSISRKSCFGLITLCRDDASFSQNGTSVTAKIGQPASVSFCVESDYTITPYIYIRHPNIKDDWYPQSPQGRIQVQFAAKETKATINITINNVQEKDFSDHFNVTLFVTNPLRPSLKLWIKLEKEKMIWPCSSDLAVPPNRTLIEAQLSAPVSFSFCAETNGKFNPDIHILHHNHTSGWYGNTQQKNDKIHVNIVENKAKVTVNITINDVEQKDLVGDFHVTVYTEEYKPLTLWFKLQQKGGATAITTAEVANASSTLSTTAATETTTKTKAATTSTATTTTSTTRTKPKAATATQPTISVSTTYVGPRCLLQTNSGCPENWYQVDDQRCLSVFSRDNAFYYPSDQCASFSGKVPTASDVKEMRSCLEYLLMNSTVKVIRSGGKNVHVETGMEVKGQSDYMVACLVHKLQVAAPTITDFSLEIKYPRQRDIWRRNLLIGGNSDVELNVTNDTLNVTCIASGNPAPEVTLTRDSGPLSVDRRGTYLIRPVDCGDSGVYTCLARNSFSSQFLEAQK